MEAIQEAMAGVIPQNAQTKTLSQSPPTSTKTIPADEHAALFTVINQVRLLNGWTMRTAKELDPTIRVWHDAFSDYKIPPTHYNRLYKRCLEMKQTRLRDANERVDIDAALMIAQWTGANGLQRQIRDEQDKRALTANAQNDCPHCYGSNWRPDEKGGVKKCDHSD